MISFKSFVTSIHQAILTANDQLMDQNLAMLDKYFIDTGNKEDLQNTLDDALKISHSISTKKGAVTQEDLQNASDVFQKAKDALSGGSITPESAQTPGTLSPKTVVIEYPRETENGMESIEVHVPLLTLTPISMSQIEKAVLTAEFDLEIVNDEVQLNFTDSKTRKGKNNVTRGSLEISITPQENSEGLKKIIDGYEKALKSQIP